MSGAIMDKVWGLFGMDPAEPEEDEDSWDEKEILARYTPTEEEIELAQKKAESKFEELRRAAMEKDE